MSSLISSFRGAPAADVDVSNIRKEGWVFKESKVLHQYRKRWLVLTPDKLYSFKTERGYDKPPTEDVDLKLCGTKAGSDTFTSKGKCSVTTSTACGADTDCPSTETCTTWEYKNDWTQRSTVTAVSPGSGGPGESVTVTGNFGATSGTEVH